MAITLWTVDLVNTAAPWKISRACFHPYETQASCVDFKFKLIGNVGQQLPINALDTNTEQRRLVVTRLFSMHLFRRDIIVGRTSQKTK